MTEDDTSPGDSPDDDTVRDDTGTDDMGTDDAVPDDGTRSGDSPFADLDADEYRDREGNPFERLGGVDSSDTVAGADTPGADIGADDNADVGAGDHVEAESSGDADGDSGQEHGERTGIDPAADPFEYLGGPAAGGESGGDGRDGGDGRPVDSRDIGDRNADSTNVDGSGDLHSDGRVAEDPLGDVDGSRGDPFESTGNPFERVDVDSVDPDDVWERFRGETGASDVEPEEAATEERDEDDVVDVSKHRFCETCPHFSNPPDVECGHPGTAILEFVDTDEVRVSNCPIVEERRELGEIHE